MHDHYYEDRPSRVRCPCCHAMFEAWLDSAHCELCSYTAAAVSELGAAIQKFARAQAFDAVTRERDQARQELADLRDGCARIIDQLRPIEAALATAIETVREMTERAASERVQALEQVHALISARARASADEAAKASDEFGTPAHLAGACKAWASAAVLVCDLLNETIDRGQGFDAT